MKTIRPVVHSVGTFDHPNLRRYQPEDPETVSFFLKIDIGQRGKKGSDSFTVHVATPKGLAQLPVGPEGTIASGKMLVIARYDYDQLWSWIEKVVALCEADRWERCLEKLRNRFHWEYEDYQVGRDFRH